ncbi:MAG TPA: Gfo/Idh/MocA family oxidoreductase [Longimicrobiaceae bacterium]
MKTQMKMKRIAVLAMGLVLAALPLLPLAGAAQQVPPGKRIGIIGLDTSHSPAFVNAFNADEPDPALLGYRVVAAYPYGSRTIESSYSRIPRYTEEVRARGVEIVGSIAELLEKVDVVLLNTNDGRLHLEQALEVFRAGKPVFIDKPVAASLADAIAIYDAAEHYGVPVFSSSTLRFTPDVQAVRGGSIGQVTGADAFSPATLEPTHPDLFWYGIHGVEILFAVMGTGCETVSRLHAEGWDVVTCRWRDGRVGTFRGLREGKTGYGGTAFGTEGIQVLEYEGGYDGLTREVAKFFATGNPPVTAEETLEIFAFMAAAEESKRREGAPVSLAEVMEQGRREAATRNDG